MVSSGVLFPADGLLPCGWALLDGTGRDDDWNDGIIGIALVGIGRCGWYTDEYGVYLGITPVGADGACVLYLFRNTVRS